MSHYGLPDPMGRSGHLDIVYAQRDERIQHRVDYGRGGSDGARLAAAFGAERVMCARLALVELGDEERQVAGARQRIIHERGGEQLSVLAYCAPAERPGAYMRESTSQQSLH